MFLANVLGNVFFCSGALCWAIVVTLAIPLFRWGDGVLPLNTGGPHGYLLNSPPTSTSTQSTGTSGGQGGGPRWACSCPPHPASSPTGCLTVAELGLAMRHAMKQLGLSSPPAHEVGPSARLLSGRLDRCLWLRGPLDGALHTYCLKAERVAH